MAAPMKDVPDGTQNAQTVAMTAETPHSIDLATHEFVIPKKEVCTVSDMKPKWEKSEAYKDLMGFICAMNDAVKNKKLTDECHVSQTTEGVLKVLSTISNWIDEIPPIDQPQRFGNKAFRDWFKRLQENAESMVKDALAEKFHPAVPEISVYLVEGVGNSTRIDYGTGHELAFIAFLCCLFKIGALEEIDSVAAVNKIFQTYLDLMRKLQQTYKMEPAGSQGVWSLDDFQFIPFLWGSSQLLEIANTNSKFRNRFLNYLFNDTKPLYIDHPRIRPKSFPNEDIASSFAKSYMFLSCINYINQVKTGPFSEHSNQLWNISGVPFWSKVNSGLIKMYKAEVLSKFPLVQHFLFGSLLSVKEAR